MIRPEQIAELSKLLSSLLVIDTTIAMSKMGTSRGNGNQRETIELVKEFLELNPELQRGALKYAKEIRRKYQGT